MICPCPTELRRQVQRPDHISRRFFKPDIRQKTRRDDAVTEVDLLRERKRHQRKLQPLFSSPEAWSLPWALGLVQLINILV